MRNVLIFFGVLIGLGLLISAEIFSSLSSIKSTKNLPGWSL